jgi:C4-dicarboxylate-specific signal transduction histidine kinase
VARASKNERTTIRHAAEAATAMLPRLKQARADLDQRMASLEAVISAYGALTGKRQNTTPAATSPTSPNRVKRGQVVEHIDTILRSEAAYDEPTIRQKLAECFEVAYKRSTVYSTLRRFKDKKYVYDETTKLWKMK